MVFGELFTKNEPIHASDLSYSHFLDDGELDFDNHNIELEDYVTKFMNTTYDSDKGVKGPTPFDDAPEEAYKWMQIIDGNINVQFRSIGDGGYYSNSKEIVSMAIAAQEQSERNGVEYSDDDDLAEDASWMQKTAHAVKNFFSKAVDLVKKAFKSAENALNKLMLSIPGVNDWWKSMINKNDCPGSL